MNKYHFSLHLQFKDDCNINKLEELLQIKAYRKSMLADSKGKNKTAKLWLKSKDITNSDTFSDMQMYVSSMQSKFSIINEWLEMYNGTAVLTLYFEQIQEKPYIKLDNSVIEILNKNHISFEVDFRL